MKMNELLGQRNLPQLLSADEMRKLLLDNVYGHIPEMAYSVDVSKPKTIEGRFLAGSVCHSTVEFTVKTKFGSHSFPVNRVLHNDGKKHPFFVFLNFRRNAPDIYYPLEEIADEGFDVLSVCYEDITADNADFGSGLAGIFLPNGQETGKTCGKIRLWAWVASRILDYAETVDTLDMDSAAVVGHSRLGKTALVAGMLDERFAYSVSNCSGCSGAALSRGNSGERISDIVKNFPYWFCKDYAVFGKQNFGPDFDQHYLIASIAPRCVYIASASMDAWADPVSEFLSCVAASKAFEDLGVEGIIHDDRIPDVEEKLHEGCVGYYNHHGQHFLSRHTWKSVMEFINLHRPL